MKIWFIFMLLVAYQGSSARIYEIFNNTFNVINVFVGIAQEISDQLYESNSSDCISSFIPIQNFIVNVVFALETHVIPEGEMLMNFLGAYTNVIIQATECPDILKLINKLKSYYKYAKSNLSLYLLTLGSNFVAESTKVIENIDNAIHLIRSQQYQKGGILIGDFLYKIFFEHIDLYLS